MYLGEVPLTLVPLTRESEAGVRNWSLTTTYDQRPETDLVLVEGEVLVHGLKCLRKGHRRGGVGDWYQAERLAGLRPEVVVLQVINRVGDVL